MSGSGNPPLFQRQMLTTLLSWTGAPKMRGPPPGTLFVFPHMA